MRLTFIGHQGWLLEDGSTGILVDPLLTEDFGSTGALRFAVYPFRRVHLQNLPKIRAVVLTTDHVQHFHLASLRLLPRYVQVFVGPLFSASALSAIKALGLTASRLPAHSPISVGDLRLTLLPAGNETPVWDKRVNSLLCEGQSSDRSVWIQSDVALEDALPALVRHRRSVDAVVCTNNSQISVWPRRGAWSNQLPVPNGRSTGPVGIGILSSVLAAVARKLEGFPLLVLSGNGHVAHEFQHGPFLWEATELERAARKLTLAQDVWGARPGEQVDLAACGAKRKNVSWIEPRSERIAELRSSVAAGRPRDIRPILTDTDCSFEAVHAALQELAGPLLMSPLGRSLCALDEHLGRPLGGERLALRLRGGRDRFLTLSVAGAEWIERDLEPGRLLRDFPAGMDVYLSDLAGLLNGDLQAWELCSASYRQWFCGSQLESPTAFLYAYFDEANRPDLSRLNYERHLAAS